MHCRNCGAALSGPYCAACGQPRLAGRLTLAGLATDVARRVFRFDRAFGVTAWRMVRAPGRLVSDYLSGRREDLLDPVQFLISSVFVQVVVSAFTHWAAPAVGRTSALAWLGQLSGVVAIKVLNIFWMGSLWRLMFRARRYNLAEIFVFAMYAFGTVGLLWALLPLVDLAVPYPLGANPLVVLTASLGLETAYMTYAIRQFSGLPLWECLSRVIVVLTVGYALLIGIVGADHVANVLLPPDS